MAKMAAKDDPSTQSLFFQRMKGRWNLMETVLGGTETMRDAAEDLLPRHMHEPADIYDERLSRSVFLNMTELTLDFLVGKPFSEPIKLGEDVPEAIVKYMDDADLKGNNIDQFAQQWFREAMAKSYSHCLIETPANPDNTRLTLEDQRKRNIRPYLVHIPPENLIAAEAIRLNGVETLTHCRFYEYETVREGFEEREEEFIRVMELVDLIGSEDPDDYRVEVTRYKKERARGGTEAWVIDEQPRITDLKTISLVTFYTNRKGFMEGKPPMLDLAYLNVAHWQSSSDQMSILTVSRFPMLAASGISDYDTSTTIVGPHGLLVADDPQGRFYYVEHGGAAISAGRMDLQDLEAQMALYGAQLLKPRPDRETATARSLDEAATTSSLQRMTFSFIDAMETVLKLMAQMIGQETGGTVRMTTDFSLNETEIVDLQTLVTARKDREISHVAFIEELKRRDVLHEDFKVEDDQDLLKKEREEEQKAFAAAQKVLDKNRSEGGDEIKGGGAANLDKDLTDNQMK